MTPDEQLELFAQYDEDQLFTAAMQLMRRIYDEVVDGGEEPVHGDLPSAIDDLDLGPWHELDQTLVGEWPYAIECRLLAWLMGRLEVVSSGASGGGGCGQRKVASASRWARVLGPRLKTAAARQAEDRRRPAAVPRHDVASRLA